MLACPSGIRISSTAAEAEFDNIRLNADTIVVDPCSAPGGDPDGDGICGDADNCPETPTGDPVDANGCSDDQLDLDSDGVLGADDNCPDTLIGVPVDASGCSAAQQQTKVTTLFGDAINLINGLGLHPSTTETLVQKLQEAQDKFLLGDLTDARSKVCDFVGELEAAVDSSSLAKDDANVLLKMAGTILGEMSFP